MSGAKVAHTGSTNLTRINSILQRLPARKSGCLSPIRTVEEEQVNVSQSRSLNRFLDRSSHSIIRLVAAGELGGVPNILALQTRRVLTTGEKVADGFTGLALVVVHLRAVKTAVAGEKALANCIGGLFGGHHVEAELDAGDDEAIVELRMLASALHDWMDRTLAVAARSEG